MPKLRDIVSDQEIATKIMKSNRDRSFNVPAHQAQPRLVEVNYLVQDADRTVWVAKDKPLLIKDKEWELHGDYWRIGRRSGPLASDWREITYVDVRVWV